jgi:hypothetical protein
MTSWDLLSQGSPVRTHGLGKRSDRDRREDETLLMQAVGPSESLGLSRSCLPATAPRRVASFHDAKLLYTTLAQPPAPFKANVSIETGY